MKRQSFITTIRSVTGKKKLKSLIRFHSANKINNYNTGGKKRKREKEKRKKNPVESTEQAKT